jgi:hypothetical protein
MKKQLPTDLISNELSESSVFFPKRATVDDPTPSLPTPMVQPQSLPETRVTAPHSPAPQTEQGTNEETFDRSNERSVERRKVRHTFDIFQDQLSSLRKLQLEREETFGKRYLLGDLVQEALDLFITKQRNNDESFERTKS